MSYWLCFIWWRSKRSLKASHEQLKVFLNVLLNVVLELKTVHKSFWTIRFLFRQLKMCKQTLVISFLWVKKKWISPKTNIKLNLSLIQIACVRQICNWLWCRHSFVAPREHSVAKLDIEEQTLHQRIDITKYKN